MAKVDAKITRQELSELAGISSGKISQISSEGFIAKAEHGKVDLKDAVSGIVRYYQERSKALPVYDSINQCSGSTGIPIAVIKSAKRLGCAAFVSTRVHLDKLLEFIFSDQNAERSEHIPIDELKRRRADEEWKLTKLERQREERELISKQEVIDCVDAAGAAFRTVLDAMPSKIAPGVIGKTEAEAEIVIRKEKDAALAKLFEGEWAKQFKCTPS